MKHILPVFISIIFLCLMGCQQIDGSLKTVENSSDNSAINETSDRVDNIEGFKIIPILYCDFGNKSISLGQWDLSLNELVVSENSSIGTTEDPYTLYSLRWNGDKTFSGLQPYLDEINHFDSTVTLQPQNYGEFIKDGVSVTISDDGKLVLNADGKSHSVSSTDITIENIGQVTPAMMTGATLSVNGDTAFYLQFLMAEDGVYLVCSVIDMSSMQSESYVVNSKPYSYEEIDIGTFGADTFAEEEGMIYFYTKGAVYSFEPQTGVVSQFLALKDLNLSSDNSNTEFQISGVTAYEENIIVECEEYVTDIPNSKTSFLCSSAGEVRQNIKWDCNKELIVFPKG